jgi:murein DD-endopeptidase MepM/ murein hydrolase activator NlpD
MIKRPKLFYYSEETVSFVEARGFRLKFAFWTLVSTVLIIGGLLVTNHYIGDLLGIDYNRIDQLVTENQLLKEEVSTLHAKLADFSNTIDKLAERDNQLRASVNLPRVDEDMRSIGTGGAKEENNYGLISRGAGDLLASSRQIVDKLEREISFQQQSYREIYNKSQVNKDLFAHIPAIKPMAGELTTHGFGMRIHPILGVLRMHEGVDITNDVGTPVYATGDGEVEFAGGSGSNYGVAVELSHGFGYKSWYAHLLRPAVRVGQHVKRGDLIAYSGNSGLSSGPHLHYEVRVNGTKVNPVSFFIDGIDYRKIREQLALAKK